MVNWHNQMSWSKHYQPALFVDDSVESLLRQRFEEQVQVQLGQSYLYFSVSRVFPENVKSCSVNESELR